MGAVGVPLALRGSIPIRHNFPRAPRGGGHRPSRLGMPGLGRLPPGTQGGLPLGGGRPEARAGNHRDLGTSPRGHGGVRTPAEPGSPRRADPPPHRVQGPFHRKPLLEGPRGPMRPGHAPPQAREEGARGPLGREPAFLHPSHPPRAAPPGRPAPGGTLDLRRSRTGDAREVGRTHRPFARRWWNSARGASDPLSDPRAGPPAQISAVRLSSTLAGRARRGSVRDSVTDPAPDLDPPSPHF